MRSARRWTTMLVAAIAIAGCTHEGQDSGPEGMFPCQEQEDCPYDWYCVEGFCNSNECHNDDTDDPGGGCPEGFYCDFDESCAQDCVTTEQCVAIYGMFYVCNEFGQCEYVSPDGGV